MNPFAIDPRKINTVGVAKYVINLYRVEVIQAESIRSQIEETLAAVLDVLVKTHPEMESDLQLLVEQARYAGHADGAFQNAQLLESQFRIALPWAIKKELAA